MSDIPNRRPCMTVDLPYNDLSCTFSFHPKGYWPCEVFFTARGKSGTEMEERLIAAGIAASKALQRKLPPEETS